MVRLVTSRCRKTLVSWVKVVVTGFATKNRNSFTGSQVSIKKDELLSVGTKNVLTSLANFVPGLSVLEDNLGGSDPNKIADINIRGRATFSGQANLPVFVVDGSQVKVDYVNDMDMNDIESITVLKMRRHQHSMVRRLLQVLLLSQRRHSRVVS